jgi:hypothetical protein
MLVASFSSWVRIHQNVHKCTTVQNGGLVSECRYLIQNGQANSSGFLAPIVNYNATRRTTGRTNNNGFHLGKHWTAQG